jgi:cytochrome P450
MTRDEDVYQDAESFLPERFLKADGTLNDDTVDYAFGFGRRYVAFTLLDSHKTLT